MRDWMDPLGNIPSFLKVMGPLEDARALVERDLNLSGPTPGRPLQRHLPRNGSH